MSDMKTFTVRQLDRETAKVMEACDAYGAVRIKHRDGRTYTLQAEHIQRRVINPPDFVARLKKYCPQKISRKQAAFVDKLIAGE
jgi:hypothetical protein